MTLVELVVLAGAVARLTRLVIEDDLLATPRDSILKRWPSLDVVFGDSEVTPGGTDSLGYRIGTAGELEVYEADDGWYPTKTYPLAKLLTCVWCLSFWVGCAVVGAWWLYPDAVVILSAPLALSYLVGRTW